MTAEKAKRKPVIQLKHSHTPYTSDIRVLRNQDLEHICSEPRRKVTLPALKENLFTRMSLQLRPTKRITIAPSPYEGQQQYVPLSQKQAAARPKSIEPEMLNAFQHVQNLFLRRDPNIGTKLDIKLWP